MNYFSKNKKWMAYLLLLTFVFTCIVPGNLSGWNNEAEAAEYSSATVFLELGGTRQLESSYLPSDGTTVMWKSNNTACATVSDSGAVTKVGYGETTVVASWSTGTENHKITWTISDGVKQTAYFYIWKPGAETSGTYQETWYYTGTGEVLVPGARASENKYYDCANIVTKYPPSESYPTITVDNQEYRYDVTGSGENYTYTVNWAYVVDTYGANDGHITIASSPSYHVDGYAVLKTPTQVTVDFEVLNPRTDGFKSVDGWPKIYDENTAIAAPRLATSQSIDGVTYYLSNWYKDAACTVKATEADFIAKTNVTFYAKYEPVFTVSTIGYDGVYDGKSHTATVTAPKGAVLEYSQDGKYWSGTEPTIKNIDEQSYQVRATLDGVTKTTEFTLKVSPKPVTITAATDSKVYDGKALTNGTSTNTGLVEGDSIDSVTVTGSQTVVGTSDNVPSAARIVNANGEDVTANYDISYASGTLEVTQRALIIRAESGSIVYDGTALTKNSYTNTELAAGDVINSVTVIGSQTVVGTSDNVPSAVKIVNANGKDVTASYGITYNKGTLTVTKRSVTLTSATDEKVYDGEVLTNDEVSVGGDGFAAGEGATYDVTGTQTAVGSSANAFTYTLNEGTKADNYSISKTEGTLTVTELTDKVTVTITEHSGSEKYDGSEKNVTGYDVAISNPLYKEADFTFSGDAAVKGTDAGSYNMELKAEDFTNTNKNFSNVEFVIKDGKLEIGKREVTLTSADDEKVYDSTALINDEVTVGGDGFAAGEGATYNVTGTQTDVGSSDNTFTYTLKGNTKAANYDITKTEGTLTVTEVTDKVTVTITENSGSEKYDGSEKTVSGYTVAISNPLYKATDFEFKGNATVKGTDAGIYNMELKASDFTNTNANFKNVEFVIVDGTLEIAKRTVTLTSADGEKVYDGTPLTNSEVTVGGDGFATGEGATYDVTGSQTNVGSSANAFTYTLNEGTKADNYTITKTEGTLQVTALTNKVTVTIKENSGNAKYDGSEKTVSGYTVAISNPLYKATDFEFKGDATVKGTDAGSYGMELKASDFTNISKNFDNVEFVIVDGTLEISPREVTLTSEDATKVYDGTALTNDEVTVDGDGFAAGEGATYDVTGTQTEAGNSANTFTYTLNEGTKAANYDITKTEGTLTVTELTDKVTVTITENSGSEKYDGTEKTVTGYTVSIDNDLYTEDDFRFSSNATVKGTDAGSYEMKLEASDFTNINTNFKNVKFVIVDGKLTVTPRKVTLTSATDSKVYDGTALTNSTVTVGGDGFVEGEGAAYDVTGSQLDPGSSANAFTYTLNEGTKADNYEITKTEGTLTVTKVMNEIVITAASDEKVYDGTALTNDSYSYTTGVLAEGDVLTAVVEGTITDAGTAANEVTSYKVMRGESDVTANYTFGASVDGKLEVTKRTVTLTSADDEKVYDGTALTNDEVIVSGDGFADGEGVAYDVTGSQTEAGNSKNTFTYTLNEGTKAGNYDISKTEGTLTVTEVTDKVTVTITENSGSEKYDGKEKTVEGYIVSIDNELYTEDDFTFSGNDTVTGTDAGIYNMELTTEDFSNTSENFTNVEFVIVDGTLEISKRTVTLTSADDEKIYDGKALTNDEVTVDGDGFAAGEGATYDVTGTQTEAGNSANTFTYTLNEGTKAANYDITKTEGTLTVTELTDKVTVTIKENSGNAKYDGTEKTVSGYIVAISNPLYKATDFEFKGDATVKGTDAGSYGMELKASDFTNNSKNFDNVEFVIVDGTLEIAKRSVTLTSADAEKVYDGTALTNKNVTVSGDGFADGEGATYNVTGAQTNVGTSDNTFTYTMNEGTDVDNYDVTAVFGTLTVTRNDNAQYKVQYWYQDPETGKYDIFGGEEMRSTTAGSLAFITEEDTVTTRSMYQFNAALSDTQKTVHVYPVNPDSDKQEYTTLNVFFDALYNVVYCYTDGNGTHEVASSGYVYGYEDKVIAPGMMSIDQFDGKWYKDIAVTDEWAFDTDTINDNIDLVDDQNTIYLYTKAKVAPLDGNTIRVEKRAYNEPEAGIEYLFNLQLIVDAPGFSAPLTSTSAVTLHRYNAAKIMAESEYNDALAALADAEKAFKNTVFRTTSSSLEFIMYENGEALFAIGTTGSAYGYETTPSVYEYNLFENSFGVKKDADVEANIVDQIVGFIKGLVNWRTPLQTLDPEMVLYGLQATGVNTSGSALAFEYDAAGDLFLAAKDLIGKEAAYEEANKALNDYLASVGRIVVINVNGEQFILNEKDADGKYIYAQDKNGNFIWSRDFGLKNGMFEDFKVEVSTGSSVQFIITETYDGGADITRVNGATTHSVYGFVTTGSTYLFENIFKEEDGGGWNPEIPTNPEENPSEPSTEPPEDSEELNSNENIPVQGPQELPVTATDKILEEPEIPLGDAPATGDTNNAVPFMVLMMFALCGLAVTRRKFN